MRILPTAVLVALVLALFAIAGPTHKSVIVRCNGITYTGTDGRVDAKAMVSTSNGVITKEIVSIGDDLHDTEARAEAYTVHPSAEMAALGAREEHYNVILAEATRQSSVGRTAQAEYEDCLASKQK